METLTIGPLRCRVIHGTGDLTVVLSHGFGAPGDDLVALTDMIDAPEGTTFVFPEAPHDLAEITGMPAYGGARAWWMIDMMKLQLAMMTGEMRDLPNEIPEGLAEARDAMNAMLDTLAPKKLVLGGFSQGAMLAMDVALRGDRDLAGVALLSGTLLAEREWKPLMPKRKGLRVFQSHGTEDPILPYELAVRLREELTKAGLDVRFEAFRGPHAIPPNVLRSLSQWLSAA
jgi:phospholipase/carboxylesterase